MGELIHFPRRDVTNSQAKDSRPTPMIQGEVIDLNAARTRKTIERLWGRQFPNKK